MLLLGAQCCEATSTNNSNSHESQKLCSWLVGSSTLLGVSYLLDLELMESMGKYCACVYCMLQTNGEYHK